MTRVRPPADRGSVTPLVIGMMFCLLLLGAGVTAAGSAFLGHQRLLNLCDGAAADAADASAATGASAEGATAAAEAYLAIRDGTVIAAAEVTPDGIQLTCRGSFAITFGALFAHPTLDSTVSVVGRSAFTTGPG